MNRMKSKKTKYLFMSSFALLIFGITVAFAAFSTSLLVTGSVTKKGGTWNINFSNTEIEEPEVSGEGTVSVDFADNNNVNVVASLFPGASATCKFKITNDGQVDAKLSSYTFSNSLLNNSSLTAELVYYDELTGVETEIIPGSDVLKSGKTVTLMLKLTHNEAQAVDEDVYINFNINIIYSQI